MNILFVLANYYPYIGGSELLFKKLTEGLVQKDHRIRVITSRLPGNCAAEQVEGVAIERVWVPGLLSQYAFTFSSLVPVVKQAGHYDIIHTASNYGALSAFLGAKVTGRPIVLTCHEVLGKRWGLTQPNLILSWAARAVERTVTSLPYDKRAAISRATRTDLLMNKAEAADVRIIYPGVDTLFRRNGRRRTGALRETCHICPDDFVYLYYGRPGITKGVEHLVRSAPQIQLRIPNSHLVLILADEPKDGYTRVCQLIGELRSACSIHMLPQVPADRRDQLVEYLLDADCVVVPSLTEGFGFTTAEACALGLPVVATLVGSIPEVVSGCHVLVEPGSPRALADGVVRIASSRYDYTPPKVFTWIRMVDEYEALYEEVLSSCT
jgi:D-inositol-3-phosphate glycosyltransferase